MAKIMEILEIKPNYSTGQTKLKLGDTGFNTTGKAFGTDATVDYLNATDNDIVAFQAIHTLYDAQQLYKPRLQNWKDDINNWVDGVRSSVSGLDNLSHFQSPSFQSGYSKEIYADGVPTDWDYMKLFVQEEKDLYDYTFKAEQYVVQTMLNGEIGEWGKTQNYGSSIGVISTRVYSDTYIYTDARIDQTDGLTVNLYDDGYVNQYPAFGIDVSGLEGVAIGETRQVKWSLGEADYGDWDWNYTLTITKHALGVAPDDGYFTFSLANHDPSWSEVDRWPYVKTWTGVTSPHFLTPTVPYNDYLKTRVLI